MIDKPKRVMAGPGKIATSFDDIIQAGEKHVNLAADRMILIASCRPAEEKGSEAGNGDLWPERSPVERSWSGRNREPQDSDNT